MKPTKQTEALFQAEEALGTNLQWLTDHGRQILELLERGI